MTQWWYGQDAWISAPVDQDKLAELIRKGRIGPKTLLWKEGMAEWHPLDAIAELQPLRAIIPPPLPPGSPPPLPENSGDPIQAAAQGFHTLLSTLRVWMFAPSRGSHPPPSSPSPPTWTLARRWPRFFARMFDFWWEMVLTGVIVGYALARFSPSFAAWLKSPGSDIVFNLYCIPLALAVDAGLYKLIGNTPGKAMLGLQVGNLDATRLGYLAYLRRNLWMWIKGMGLAFPLISLFFMAYQGERLHKGRQTSYDDAPENYRVRAKPIGWGRRTAFGVAFASLLLALAALNTFDKGQRQQQLSATASTQQSSFNDRDASVTSREKDPPKIIAPAGKLTPVTYDPFAEAVSQRGASAAQNSPKAYRWTNPVTGRSINIDSVWRYSEKKDSAGKPSYQFTTADGQTVVSLSVSQAPGLPFDRYVAWVRKRFAEQFIPLTDVHFDAAAKSWRGAGTAEGVGTADLRMFVFLDMVDSGIWQTVAVVHSPDRESEKFVDAFQATLWATYF